VSRREGWWPQTPCLAIAGLDLRASALRVLLALHHHADADGVAWPSQERLGAVTGLHRRSVNKALDELVDAGIVERTEEYRHRARVYRVHLDDLSPTGHTSAPGDLSPNGHMSPDDVCPAGPTTCRPQGTQTDQQQTRTPEQTKDLSETGLIDRNCEGQSGLVAHANGDGHTDAGDRALELIEGAELSAEAWEAFDTLAVEEPDRLLWRCQCVADEPMSNDAVEDLEEWLVTRWVLQQGSWRQAAFRALDMLEVFGANVNKRRGDVLRLYRDSPGAVEDAIDHAILSVDDEDDDRSPVQVLYDELGLGADVELEPLAEEPEGPAMLEVRV
jgi:DNA-binding transcriptional ArsR family regulator